MKTIVIDVDEKKRLVDLIVRYSSIQDVNKTYKMSEIDNSLYDFICKHIDKRRLKKAVEINVLNLVSNVVPHDDESFTNISMLSPKATLFVLKSDRKDSIYPDSDQDNHFFHDGEFETVTVNDINFGIIDFDSSKTHAMMISSYFVGFCVWYSQ